MKILIVDDEPPARERLQALVEELRAGEVVGHAGNGAQALRAVEQGTPDVVLLDIRMPGMDGLEVARHLARTEAPPAVIFTTAYDRHALAAFEANAVGYLLKPIRRERLEAALEQARRLSRAQLAALAASGGLADAARTHISATMHGRLQLVPVEDVRYFRAEDKYVTVRFPGGQVLIDDSLAALEEEFGQRFLRVHRNALVAPGHVTSLERDGRGYPCLHLDGVDEAVAVSRRLAGKVRRLLRGKPPVTAGRWHRHGG